MSDEKIKSSIDLLRDEIKKMHDLIDKMNKNIFGDRRQKLDEQKVSDIRGRYLLGETQVHLAREYGVSINTVWNVVNNKSWLG